MYAAAPDGLVATEPGRGIANRHGHCEAHWYARLGGRGLAGGVRQLESAVTMGATVAMGWSRLRRSPPDRPGRPMADSLVAACAAWVRVELGTDDPRGRVFLRSGLGRTPMPRHALHPARPYVQGAAGSQRDCRTRAESPSPVLGPTGSRPARRAANRRRRCCLHHHRPIGAVAVVVVIAAVVAQIRAAQAGARPPGAARRRWPRPRRGRVEHGQHARVEGGIVRGGHAEAARFGVAPAGAWPPWPGPGVSPGSPPTPTSRPPTIRLLAAPPPGCAARPIGTPRAVRSMRLLTVSGTRRYRHR